MRAQWKARAASWWDSKERIPQDGSYKMTVRMIAIAEVMLHERIIPEGYINERGNDVTEAFVDWCRPLIGPALRDFIDYI